MNNDVKKIVRSLLKKTVILYGAMTTESFAMTQEAQHQTTTSTINISLNITEFLHFYSSTSMVKQIPYRSYTAIDSLCTTSTVPLYYHIYAAYDQESDHLPPMSPVPIYLKYQEKIIPLTYDYTQSIQLNNQNTSCKTPLTFLTNQHIDLKNTQLPMLVISAE